MTTASSRPSLRSSSGRSALQDQLRSSTDHIAPHDHVTTPSSVTTRRAAHTKAAHREDFGSTPARKRVKLSPDAPASLSKRSTAPAIRSASHDRPRPPTKVTVTQPHGNLLTTTNGVQTTLNIKQDDITSTASTPQHDVRSHNGTPGPSKDKSTEKRSLRSKDGGGRVKSELATYFANYDDVITDAPREPEFLNLDTAIYIVDDSKASKSKSAPSELSPNPAKVRRFSSASAHPAAHTIIPPMQTDFPIMDFSNITEDDLKPFLDADEDPLAESKFFKAHRRAERKEKQLRNIEKERAMHEKVQLERLLEALQGPDWLKVMGVTGVTDGERKDWEPKRDYFVAEVQALVDKFRIWKEEERRQRAEKEAALHAKEEAEEDEDAADESDDDGDGSEGPDSSELDASAAQQLLQEANSASRVRKKTKMLPDLSYLPPPEEDPNKPFTSFFTKPHLRAQALGQHRHGRVSLAFGQPVPEPEEAGFGLPPEYLTPDALKDHARKKRRMKRESVGNV